MPTFVYKVKDETGKTFSGVLEAEDIKALRKKLRDSGYYVVFVSSYRKKRRLSLFEEKITLDTLTSFTHQLSSMIEAGLPILMALDILWREIENSKMQVVISQIRNRLKEGKSLSEAVGEFPTVFPIMYRALLSVAESGGGLVSILKKLVEYLNNQKQFISKIKKATTYPMIVVFFAVIVVVLMLILVVPTFQKVFAKINVELPLLTQMIVSISNLMRTFIFWFVTAGAIFFLYFLYRTIKANPRGHLLIDKIKLRLPLFGKIFYTAAVGRFIRSLSLLLGGGLPAAKSIEVAKAAAVNKEIENSLEWVEKRIIEGVSLNESLRETRFFPMLLVEMAAVGEQSGTLVEMLERVANHFEEELEFRLNKFLTLLEPLLIFFVGGVVVFVLLSIYLPIFKLWRALPGG